MKRDLTKSQFEYQAEKLGFHKELFGYWHHKEIGVSIYPSNAGPRRRDQIIYLKQQLKRHQERG